MTMTVAVIMIMPMTVAVIMVMPMTVAVIMTVPMTIMVALHNGQKHSQCYTQVQEGPHLHNSP
uniref:Uncharacterized protein n=1 Tax=Anguilla anguilla TaxID=7936 RepID=A0A0E9PVG3_ANGAN